MKSRIKTGTFSEDNSSNLAVEILSLKTKISKISSKNELLENNLSQLSNKQQKLTLLTQSQKEDLEAKDSELEAKDSELKSKKFEILYYKKLLFGRRSERAKYLTDSETRQLNLFDDIQRYETEEEEIKKEASLINEAKELLAESKRLKALELEYKQKEQRLSKKKRGRKSFKLSNPNIEVERKELDISEAAKQCSCGCILSKIGEETSETIEYIPASLKIIEHVRFKYACKSCEGNIKLAEKADKIFDRSSCSSSLLSHILINKFEDHLPFYRQSKRFKRYGINIDRKLMNNWLFKSSKLLAPIFMELKNEISSGNYLSIDETPVNILDKSKSNQAYMWVYHSKEEGKKLLYYDFCLDRSSANPQLFIPNNYAGYIQTDGYSGYNFLKHNGKITRLGCMAHVRRKFHDIAKLIKVTDSNHRENIISHNAFNKINRIYLIEKRIRIEKITDKGEIYKIRQEEIKPLLEELYDYLKEQERHILNNSPIYKAVNYFLNNYKYLKNYLKDGELDIDNNKTENAIRPFALGRKNWMFVGDEQGGTASGTIYSLIESAKLNNLHTEKYLKFLFDNIKKYQNNNNLKDLLPNRIDKDIVNKWV